MPVERARTMLEMGDRLGDVALVDEARAAFETVIGLSSYCTAGYLAPAGCGHTPGRNAMKRMSALAPYFP